ncbi:hypothetical protein A2Y85_06330 [candidate division WOR-3 bacterium RBG_13_43_14]|uniref:FlgD Ig-like domain-containing protein n=1 Tax=candidate division WOR-3 bacterium RBG_13_43_14 TaxID=1802590 RepID=A0A1F4UCL7_UNCW3|nr:MAG: hypothetical protein A2Y85_06330 [candidate division WOR-3 bacterium RBG_13_43_14]
MDTLPGSENGSAIVINDIDDNGLNKIIISGNNQIYIYEYSPNPVEEAVESDKQLPRLTIQPNPFSKATVIQWRFDNGPYSGQKTALKICNATGKIGHECPSNSNASQLIWHGIDKNDKSLPGGIYFARLKVNGYRAIESWQ